MCSDTSKSISIKIAIDIPVDVAEATLRNIKPLLAGIAPSEALIERQHDQQFAPAPDKSPAQLEAEEEERRVLAANKQRFARMIVQAYRRFRRIVNDFDKPYDAYRVIAQEYDWPVSVVSSMVAGRRRKINNYVRYRRYATVERLVYSGWSNKAIGNKLGLHDRSIARISREIRKEGGIPVPVMGGRV